MPRLRCAIEHSGNPMKARIAWALICLNMPAWSAATVPELQWYGYNVHAGICERLSGFEESLEFFEGARTPAEFLQRLSEHAPDAKQVSFLEGARADAAGKPMPADQAQWLENFSPTNAYLISSEALGVELPLVTSEVCGKLGLSIESAPADADRRQ